MISFEFFDREKVEGGALAQLYVLKSLPFTVAVASMPDIHQGVGVPIGTVLATKNVVIPNAVGVDIGCSMTASLFNASDVLHTELLRKISDEIKKVIPVGNNNLSGNPEGYMDITIDDNASNFCKEEFEKRRHQIGTLGGGNHFIEIQRSDMEGQYCLMIHSGSRSFGHSIATYYNNIAKELNGKWYSKIDPKVNLAFIPFGDPNFDSYITDASAAEFFAFLSHRSMLRQCLNIIYSRVDANVVESIYTKHNFVSLENHFGQNVYVHRKGAVKAIEGRKVIIPGSMGSPSYIAVGLGEKTSLTSCSHGAGRLMSRTSAKGNLDLTQEMEKLKGVVTDMTSIDKLDEAPGAYKDIDEVMKLQEKLVTPVTKLYPLMTMKG